MKAIIIDDELNAIDSLKALLEIFGTTVNVVGQATNIKDAVSVINACDPDIVFLDIELRDGLGMDVLDHFPKRTFKVVFVTAYEQYAIKAFKLRAFDYLLKPIDPEDLEALVAQLEKEMAKEAPRNVTTFQRMSIPTQHGVRMIDLDKIVRLESDNNYTRLILDGGEEVLVTRTLKKFENSLPETDFIRVHQRHMINWKTVVEYTKQDGGFLILDNGSEIPVSRKNKALIEKALEFGIIKI